MEKSIHPLVFYTSTHIRNMSATEVKSAITLTDANGADYKWPNLAGELTVETKTGTWWVGEIGLFVSAPERTADDIAFLRRHFRPIRAPR